MKKIIFLVALSSFLTACSKQVASPHSSPSNETAVQQSAMPAEMTQNVITIQNFAFAPQSITVKAGSTVTVTNLDSTGHNVAATDKSFQTEILSNGQSATFKAPTKPGTYDFICEVHPMMKGQLIVQ